MSDHSLRRAPRRAGAKRLAGWRPRLPTTVSGRLLVTLIPVVGLILAWWALTLYLDRSRIYPPPPLIVTVLMEIAAGRGELGSAYAQIGATLYRLVVAFVLSLLLGTVLGIVAGRVRAVFDLLDNVMWVFMAVPSIVWVFIFVVALGITDLVPIAAISALLTPMVILNVAEGGKSIPKDIVEMAYSYKAGRVQRVVDVYVPYLVPYIASSARVAFALGIKLIVIAEVVGLSSGIGYEVKYWYDRLFMGPIMAWGIVMIGIGLLVDYGIFGPLERRANRWKGATRRELAPGRIG